MKELGFWEVNEATLKDVHEVAPTQEEMQAAADAASSPEVTALLETVSLLLRSFANKVVMITQILMRSSRQSISHL